VEASSVPALLHRSRTPVPAPRLRLCSDDQLVERFRAGRDEAFRVIHDRYRARLLAYVRQMLSGRSGEDVEDVLQDVFERAARTLRAGATPVGLRPWLYSVAHNRCIDELRRRPPSPPDVFAASRPPAGDTSAVAERRADVERLFSDLRALPEVQRSAILMRELQGLSHAELAEVLDASVPAVKSLLVRARVGLVCAEEARGVPCETIREDLAAAHDRHVKASAQTARHLRECAACRSYRAQLRRTSRRLAALVPGPTLFPLAALGRLLGGGSVHAEMPALATSVAGSGGAAFAGAGKLAALLGAATVVTTGAVLERDHALPWSSSPRVHHAAAGGGGQPAAVRVTTKTTGRTAPTAGRHPTATGSAPASSGTAASPAAPAPVSAAAGQPPAGETGAPSSGTSSPGQPPADPGSAAAGEKPAAAGSPPTGGRPADSPSNAAALAPHTPPDPAPAGGAQGSPGLAADPVSAVTGAVSKVAAGVGLDTTAVPSPPSVAPVLKTAAGLAGASVPPH
jgi:RNA polymerase sigma factor (sigma-70 family)